MNIKRGLATLAIAALSLTSLAACGSDTAQDEEKPDSLSFWYYEEDDAGQTQAWRRAAKAFEKETGVKINFERKSFTQIAQNGSQFLNSDEAPDLMESNRGNGSAGVLSTMGLLTDLGDYVKQYGWDKKVTGANAAVAKYDENGIMDGDTWYGMTSYAEFQRVYYNKDLFAKYNIKIPTTYDEFVDACQKFVDAGVTPIAADAQEYGVMWLWWQLVSKNADSKFIDNWQLYRGDVDWNSKVLTNSVKTINEWLDKGFISRNATGMKAEDTTQAFIKGEYPIYQTGTWNQGRFVKQIKSFDWDAAVMPESNYAVGCAGNLLVIPEKSHHKDLSAKFIDYVLSDDVQKLPRQRRRHSGSGRHQQDHRREEQGHDRGIRFLRQGRQAQLLPGLRGLQPHRRGSSGVPGAGQRHQEAGRRAQEHPREVRHRRRGYGRQEQLKTTDPSFPFQLQ